jgi:hypothetical protein
VSSGPLVITKANAATAGKVHYRSILDNEHLGQWDLGGGRPTVVIESVQPYFPRKRKKTKRADGSFADEPIKKLLIRFVGKTKGWISGPATQQVIAKMYGRNIGDWIGKKITLYVDNSVMFGRENTGGIRVLAAMPSGPATEDPLDRDVDADIAERIANAKEFTEDEAEPGREPGEEG